MEQQGNANSACHRAPGRSARRWRVGALAVYALAMTAAQLLPGGKDAPGGWDAQITSTLQNGLHVPAYAGLCVLALAVLAERGAVGWVLAIAGCLAHGAGLEWAQTAIPGRTGSWSDMVLNVVGVAVGAGAWFAWRRIRAGRVARAGETPT